MENRSRKGLKRTIWKEGQRATNDCQRWNAIALVMGSFTPKSTIFCENIFLHIMYQKKKKKRKQNYMSFPNAVSAMKREGKVLTIT